MSAVVADTHAIIWYFRSPDKLSLEAAIALDGAVNNGYPIYLSAISLVEITYLVERGDRIIAATALYLGLPLVTKDHKIRELSIIQTIWDNPNPNA